MKRHTPCCVPSRILVCLLSLQTALGPVVASAQSAPVMAPAPADSLTTVTNSANATPVVNIAAPNAAGVSHNRYSRYDVDARGLVINNSSTNAISVIGGGVAANPNLAGSTSASLILNEVTAANAGSMLRGYQEILGPQAELVIANPWGVTCDGCGFLNTPRVTLTTGVPTLQANGGLAGFTITGGQIAISGAGLDASRQATLDLLARNVVVNGDVIVGNASQRGDLQIIGGAHQFDYAERAASSFAASGAVPQFAIDSSALGGMYADRIRLIVDEQGAGVRTAGDIAALGDDLIISANGRIELRGAASAARDLSVSGVDIQAQLADADTYIYGGRDLTMTASGALDIGTGSVGARGNASFSAASLRSAASANDARFAGGALRIDVVDAADVSGGMWTAPQLSFTAGALTIGANATLYGYGDVGSTLTLTTLGLLAVNGGQIYSGANAVLDVQRANIDANSVVAADGALALTVAGGNAGGLDNAGVIQGGSVALIAAVNPSAPTAIRNRASGQIVATDALSIAQSGAPSATGAALINEGVLAADNVAISMRETRNLGGAIQATTRLDITSASVRNDGADAVIIGSNIASGSATITAGDVTNSGVIWSQGDLTLNPLTLEQQRVAGATSNPLIGAGRDLSIAFADRADLGTGDLQAGRDLSITGTRIVDRGVASGSNSDLRIAGRHLSATAQPGGDVDVAGGQWYAQGDLRLTGDAVNLGSYFDQQQNARVSAPGVQLVGAGGGAGTVALTARTGGVVLDGDAAVFSGDALAIEQQTAFALNDGNVLQADGRVAITANANIDNSGLIAGGTVELASNGAALTFTNRGTGIVIGDRSVRIGTETQRAQSIVIEDSAAGGGVYGGALDIHTLNLQNFGDIQAGGPGEGTGSLIQADALYNAASGRIMGFTDASGNGGLTILSRSIDNHGFLYDSSLLWLDANEIVNRSGAGIGGAGRVHIGTLGDGTGSSVLDNLGDIWGYSVEMLLYNGLVNGRDPGDPLNRGYTGSIYADANLLIAMVGAVPLTNYGSIESAGDMQLYSVGLGGASLHNEMSMVPDSETRWLTAGSPRSESGYLGLVSGSDRHERSIDGQLIYFFGDTTGTGYFDRRSTYLQTQVLGIDPASIAVPTIRAGGNLVINGFQSVENTGASLGADGDVTITSTTPGSSVTNSSLYLRNRDEIREAYERFQCDDAAGTDTFCTTAVNLDAEGSTSLPRRYSVDRQGAVAFAGRIYAGGNLNIQVPGNVTNSGSTNPFAPDPRARPSQIGAVGVAAPGTPGARGGATTLILNGAQLPLPTNQNGRFVPAQSSGAGPLIETNPLFGIDSAALGSEYLARLLGLAPEEQARRLGDDDYEAYLIQQQVKAATGRGVLETYYSADQMTQALFDNAADEAQRLDLGFGKTLTSEQIASLKSDIVWMVEQEVQGQKVLVPVVYLSDATRGAITNNSTIAGYNTNIEAGELRNVGGEITAVNSLRAKTSGNIENLSGRMAGWNVQLDAGGDIVNSTLVRRYGDAQNGNDAAERTGSIEAGNVAILKAGRDIDVKGAWVTAGKDAALIAERNVNIEALVLTSNSHWEDGEDYSTSQHQSAHAAGVAAGGNLAIQARNDVNIKGADVSAGGRAAIRAEEGDVNIGVVELTNTTTTQSTYEGRYDQLDRGTNSLAVGFGHEQSTTTDTTTSTVGAGSRVAGGSVVVSTGKGDVNVTGSAIQGGEDGIVIDSAADVNITAYYDRSDSSSTSKTTRAGLVIDMSTDGVHAGTRQSGDESTTTTTQTTARTSTLTSGGNVVIRGQGDVVNEGTRFDAAGDVVLAGENVINKAAQDTYSTSTTGTEWETKQQAGFTLNGTGSSIHDAAEGRSRQVAINTPEAQVRLTGSGSSSTQSASETHATGTQINAGGNVVVLAKNDASDTGTQYSAGQNIVISAENYENKAAADTRSSSSERTYGSGLATVGVNATVEATATVSAEGGHERSSDSQSTARVGGMKAGGAVVIEARSGDVVLEGTQIDGAQGVGISAARDLDIRQANDTTTASSSSETGSGRLSGSVSLVGAGASVGGGASARTAESDETTSTARTANIRSGAGNVQLDAGRDLTSQGANIEAAGNVALAAGRNIDLAAATDTVTKTASVDGGGADVNVGFGTGAAKGNGSVGVSTDFERSRTDYEATTERGSTIKAGGNFSVTAGNDARLEGTQVDAGSAALRTGGNLTIESAQSTVKDDSYSVSGRIEGSGSKGGGTGGANSVGQGTGGNASKSGGNAGGGNAQVNVTRSYQDIETNSNASINTRGGTTIDVGGDMVMAGANINAQGGVSGAVKGNLDIESRVDKVVVDQSDVKTYAGLAPVGGSGGGGKFDRAQEGVQTTANHVAQTGAFVDVEGQKKDNRTVGTASGISGGAGGIDLKVGGDTTLTGAANRGSDFKTQGRTTVKDVETRVSESSTDFRMSGTVASAAGSDQGKGGDYGLSVAGPGDHNAPNLPKRPVAYGSDGPGSVGAPRPRPIDSTPAGGDTSPTMTRPRTPIVSTPTIDSPRATHPAPTIHDPAAAPSRQVHAIENTRLAARPIDPRPADRSGEAGTSRVVPNDGVINTTAHDGGIEERRAAAPLVDPATSPRGRGPVLEPDLPPDARAAVLNAADSDPRVQGLLDLDTEYPALDRLKAQQNLAEIVNFTSSPDTQALRGDLLAQMNRSLQGPQVRADGLTEFPIHPNYVGENVPAFKKWFKRDFDEPGTVRYFNEQERQEQRLYLQGGELVFADGSNPRGDYIFVVDRNGHLIASKPKDFVIHHSSLAGGEPVLMAGQMSFDSGGSLIMVDNSSGHFRPPVEAFQHFLASLRDSGVSLALTTAPAVATVQRQDGGAFTSNFAANLLQDAGSLHTPAMMLKDLTAPRPAFGRDSNPDQAPDPNRNYKTNHAVPSDDRAEDERRNYKIDIIRARPSGEEESRDQRDGDPEATGDDAGATVEGKDDRTAHLVNWTRSRRSPRSAPAIRQQSLAEFRLAA